MAVPFNIRNFLYTSIILHQFRSIGEFKYVSLIHNCLFFEQFSRLDFYFEMHSKNIVAHTASSFLTHLFIWW